MFFIWLLLFNSQPAFLILGLLGIFGKEAEEAASFTAMIWGVMLVVIAALAILYYLGTWILGLLGVSSLIIPLA
jgi:hypothetical protein